MVNKTFELTIDLKRPMSNREFELVGEDSGNIIICNLFDDGQPLNLTGCRVCAVFAKRNGTALQDSADGSITISSNKVTINLKSASYSTGTTECELQIYSSSSASSGTDTLVTTARFNFGCRAAIFGSETASSTSEYPFLVNLLNSTEGAVRDCNAATQRANEAAAFAGGYAISVGSVSTLPAGSMAEVTNAGSGNNVVLNFKIPRGSDNGAHYQLSSFMTAYGSGTLNNELYLNGVAVHDTCYMLVNAIKTNGTWSQIYEGEFQDITYTDCKAINVSVYSDSAYTQFLAGCSCTCGANGSMENVIYSNRMPTASDVYPTGTIWFYVPSL